MQLSSLHVLGNGLDTSSIQSRPILVIQDLSAMPVWQELYLNSTEQDKKLNNRYRRDDILTALCWLFPSLTLGGLYAASPAINKVFLLALIFVLTDFINGI